MLNKNSHRSFVSFIPQTGLALIGFSRYCPSSLDLPNFVVQSCRGAAAEGAPAISGQARPKPGPQISGNLEIWGPGNPPIRNPETQTDKNIKIQIRSVQSVRKAWISRKKSSWRHLVSFQALKFCLSSLVGQWALFTRFGVMCWCHLSFMHVPSFGCRILA